MSKLPPPEQWALYKLNEMEVAELIERHIDFYREDKSGNRRPVHLNMTFVRHFMRRDDNVLPTTVAYATMPLVLADGTLLAPKGLDRPRGIQFRIPDELRAIIPAREDCSPERVAAAMEFLCNEWLVDVAADHIGKALLIAAGLTLIERSLLADRPCFFVTAGRRGSGKSTAITMLIVGVIGDMPAASAWSSNEEERRKALMSHFMLGMPYILWDNIPRGLQISCPHIERSCTTAIYSDRRLGVSEIVRASAATIHFFNGNNIGPKGDLASRSLNIRISADRADPENRSFTHPNPFEWTKRHRGEILSALFTILLGNPHLATPQEADGKTRFKIWWRLVGSAVEHAARLMGAELDFGKLFAVQETGDEETAALADALEIMLEQWPAGFAASEMAELINDPGQKGSALRDFLAPGAHSTKAFSSGTTTRMLQNHLDAPVLSGERTLVLRAQMEKHRKILIYKVENIAVE